MALIRWTTIALLLASVLLPAPGHAADGEAAQLFQKYSKSIFQIRLIDLAAEEKSALGSGFLVSADGVMATNYHVIEQIIRHPDKYRIEYLGTDGSTGGLTLLSVDVINDLALLQSEGLQRTPLEFVADYPPHGASIYSLGNPHDIGFTVVPGTYNGVSDNSVLKRIHFSGSINPGMSGGPALDAQGRVVGINVSTAGNQISFLVPVGALRNLLDTQGVEPVADQKKLIHKQLVDYQKTLIDGLVASEWKTQKLGEATVIADIPHYAKCWGSSSDEKWRYKQVSSLCRNEESIYLSSGFNTGVVTYQFFWMEADKLNRWQFYNFYEKNLFGLFRPDNSAGKLHAGKFVCDEIFLDDSNNGIEKAVLCTRGYRDYPDLFDVMFIGGSVHDNEKAFVRHFTLAGVTRESTDAFLNKFMATATWQQ